LPQQVTNHTNQNTQYTLTNQRQTEIQSEISDSSQTCSKISHDSPNKGQSTSPANQETKTEAKSNNENEDLIRFEEIRQEKESQKGQKYKITGEPDGPFTQYQIYDKYGDEYRQYLKEATEALRIGPYKDQIKIMDTKDDYEWSPYLTNQDFMETLEMDGPGNEEMNQETEEDWVDEENPSICIASIEIFEQNNEINYDPNEEEELERQRYEEEIHNTFGELGPYVDDYQQEEYYKDWVDPEDEGKRPNQFNQNSVLNLRDFANQYQEETDQNGFENRKESNQNSHSFHESRYDQEAEIFKVHNPPERDYENPDTESITCERYEEEPKKSTFNRPQTIGQTRFDNGYDERLEPFPSSLRPTAFERGLRDPSQRPPPDLTAEEVLQKKLSLFLRGRLPIPSGIPTDNSSYISELKTEIETLNKRIKETEKPKTETSLQTSMSELKDIRRFLFYDEEEVKMFKECMSFETILHIIGFNFLFILTIFGLIVEAGTYTLTVSIVTTYQFIFNIFLKLKGDWTCFKQKRYEHRRIISLRNAMSLKQQKHERHSSDPFTIHQNRINPFKGFVVPPLRGVQLLRPGPARVSYSAPRKLVIDKVRISEARVEVSDQRPFVKIILPDGIARSALYDTGSTSCTISPKLLKELQKTTYIPIEERDFSLKGVIPGVTSTIRSVAYLDIKLETGYSIKNVPFMVVDSNFSLILGNNIVRSQRWCNFWKNNDFYIDMGKSFKPVKAIMKSCSTITGVSIACVQLLPGQKRAIPVRIPELQGQRRTEFHKGNVMVTSVFGDEQEGIEVVKSVSRIGRQNQIGVIVANKTDQPMVISEDTPVAKIEICSEKENQLIDITEYQKTKIRFDSIPRVDPHAFKCHDEIRNIFVKQDSRPEDDQNETSRKERLNVFIQFSDRYGMTATNDNLVDCRQESSIEVSPLEELKPGIIIKKHFEDKIGKEDTDPGKIAFTILLIPDENGGYDFITNEDFHEARKEMKRQFESYGLQKPNFFFSGPTNCFFSEKHGSSESNA
jgi:hypothetical protein